MTDKREREGENSAARSTAGVAPWLIAASIATLGVAEMSHAQATRYEVIDLGVLDSNFTDFPSWNVARRINEQMQIVGWSFVGSDANPAIGTPHATLWVYCPAYGFGAMVLHDLGDTSGLGDDTRAYQINESGIIVGHGPSTLSTSVVPTVWDLTAGPDPVTGGPDITLGELIGSGSTLFGAFYGMNDDSPPALVGEWTIDPNCGPSGGGVGGGTTQNPGGGGQVIPPAALPEQTRAVIAYWNGTTVVDEDSLAPEGTDTSGGAWAVTNADSSNELDITGWSTVCGSTIDQALCVAGETDGTQWSVTSGVTPTGAPNIVADAGAAGYTYDVNDARERVGWVNNSGEPNCPSYASYWPFDSAASPAQPGARVDLHTVAGFLPNQVSFAYGMNEAPGNVLHVVGENLSTELAYRWVKDSSGTWSATDLNDLISPLCGWTIVRAFDVNDSGWIVGVGLFDPAVGNDEFRAVLLKPVECVGDLDGDCDVDGADLTILNGAFGCTAPCADCNADLDGDGAVSGADTTILLGNWGAACECFGCPAPAGRQAAQQGGGGEAAASDALYEAIALLGFDSVPALVEELERSSPAEVEQMTAFIRVYMESRR